MMFYTNIRSPDHHHSWLLGKHCCSSTPPKCHFPAHSCARITSHNLSYKQGSSCPSQPHRVWPHLILLAHLLHTHRAPTKPQKQGPWVASDQKHTPDPPATAVLLLTWCGGSQQGSRTWAPGRHAGRTAGQRGQRGPGPGGRTSGQRPHQGWACTQPACRQPGPQRRP